MSADVVCRTKKKELHIVQPPCFSGAERGIEPPTYALGGLDASVFSIQQRVAPSIYSDINFDGTLARNLDATPMPQL
jgi:hypothetical protein